MYYVIDVPPTFAFSTATQQHERDATKLLIMFLIFTEFEEFCFYILQYKTTKNPSFTLFSLVSSLYAPKNID